GRAPAHALSDPRHHGRVTGPPWSLVLGSWFLGPLKKPKTLPITSPTERRPRPLAARMDAGSYSRTNSSMASFSVVSNVASMNAQANLLTTNLGLNKALTRLSSGFRINMSGD